jgi:hypothetical protein
VKPGQARPIFLYPFAVIGGVVAAYTWYLFFYAWYLFIVAVILPAIAEMGGAD